MEELMAIKWEDKYSVKIKKIDDQHQTFFRIINHLEESTKHDNFMDDLPRLINEVVEYCGLHFKTEEEYMGLSNYKNIDNHKLIHNEFEREIRIECSKVLEKEATTLDVMWLYNYLMDWIKKHILEEDHKYIDSLKKYHDK